jgi:hypothetical protein
VSYIDTIDHELVGLFAGLPVYHPLEMLAGDSSAPADFACTPANLVIGGGGGEHPGCVLLRPDAAVAAFISAWLAAVKNQEIAPESPVSDTIAERWAQFVDTKRAVSRDVLLFAGWSDRQYAAFCARCTSSTLWHPFVSSDRNFDDWLIASLGEFVFFAMPDLVPALDENLPQARYHIRMPLYMNVLAPPRGYNLPFGRQRRGDKIVWGNVKY